MGADIVSFDASTVIMYILTRLRRLIITTGSLNTTQLLSSLILDTR